MAIADDPSTTTNEKDPTAKEKDKEEAPARNRTALEVIQRNGNVAGRRFVITGAYSGIGIATTKAILKEGGKVVLGGPDRHKLEEFTQQLRDYYGDNINGYVLDLADLASVKEFAKCVGGKFAHIDVLILNAGIMKCPPSVTEQGFERQMGINVVGHFLLAKLLMGTTKRQVWVSSAAHADLGAPRIDIDAIINFCVDDASNYNASKAYQQSKLGNILLAKEFHRRYNVEAASCHPGVIKTNIARYMTTMDTIKFITTKLPSLFAVEGLQPFKTPEQGAATTLTVATLPSEELQNGAYYKDCVPAEEAESARNMDDARALFDFCDEKTKSFQLSAIYPNDEGAGL